MAITTTNASAASIAKLVTRVRRSTGDVSTTAANQRFSDTDIVDSINLELMKMQTEMGINNPEPYLTSTTINYSGQLTDLPATLEASQIFLVEEYDDPDRPLRMDYISPLDLDRHVTDFQYVGGRKRWSILGGNIAVRPVENLTIRVWYLQNPLVIAEGIGGLGYQASSDQHSLFVQHEELISLGAAIRLQEIDEEIPAGRIQRYQDLFFRFLADLRKNKGPVYVRRNRRFR